MVPLSDKRNHPELSSDTEDWGVQPAFMYNPHKYASDSRTEEMVQLYSRTSFLRNLEDFLGEIHHFGLPECNRVKLLELKKLLRPNSPLLSTKLPPPPTTKCWLTRSNEQDEFHRMWCLACLHIVTKHRRTRKLDEKFMPPKETPELYIRWSIW